MPNAINRHEVAWSCLHLDLPPRPRRHDVVENSSSLRIALDDPSHLGSCAWASFEQHRPVAVRRARRAARRHRRWQAALRGEPERHERCKQCDGPCPAGGAPDRHADARPSPRPTAATPAPSTRGSPPSRRRRSPGHLAERDRRRVALPRPRSAHHQHRPLAEILRAELPRNLRQDAAGGRLPTAPPRSSSTRRCSSARRRNSAFRPR